MPTIFLAFLHNPWVQRQPDLAPRISTRETPGVVPIWGRQSTAGFAPVCRSFPERLVRRRAGVV